MSNELIRNWTHKPDDSSNLTFWLSRSSWTIGQDQIWIRSCEHACRIAPGSSGSSQSTPSWLSKLVRSDLISRLKAFFQGVVELMAISLDTCLWGGLRWVASDSPDPAMVKRRIRVCSTWMRGSNRGTMQRSSEAQCEIRCWPDWDVDGPS